jgi:hypothetical protein
MIKKEKFLIVTKKKERKESMREQRRSMKEQ